MRVVPLGAMDPGTRIFEHTRFGRRPLVTLTDLVRALPRLNPAEPMVPYLVNHLVLLNCTLSFCFARILKVDRQLLAQEM